MDSSRFQEKGICLLLEYDESLIPEDGSAIICLMPALVKSKGKDAAGHAFHQFALMQAGLLELEDSEESSDESATYEDSETQDETEDRNNRKHLPHSVPSETSWKKSKKLKSKVKKSHEKDLYALIGLENERWMATDQQIIKAYRKVCLQCHPDKVQTKSEEEKLKVEEKFKEILSAYETLSNPESRKLYDSTDTFDDSLPEDCSPSDFFKVFGPAFRRNTRWSVSKSVPDIGDENSDWKSVSAFYDFWFYFKSWREFPHPEEEDPEMAENREHRRWITKQNLKLRQKAKKEEMKRYRDFVEKAYQLDPRVKKHLEEEKNAREQKKREKAEAKLKVEREAEEARLKEEEEKRAKALEEQRKREELERQNEKKMQAMGEMKIKLKTICSNGEEALMSESSAAELANALDFEKLEKLIVFLDTQTNKEKSRKILERAVEEVRKKKEEAIKAAEMALKEARRKELEKQRKKLEQWTEEELRLFDKAMLKYPQGTPKRWDMVTNYVRTRDLEEILLMVKVTKGASAQRFNSQENWRPKTKKEKFSNPEPTNADSSYSNNFEEDSSKCENVEAKVVSSGSGEWNKEQEVALVKALKDFGRDVDNRWDRITEMVPGKTKVDCFKRFKELRQAFGNRK